MNQNEENEFVARICNVFDGKAAYGLVLVLDQDGTIDYAHNVTTTEVRDALLSFARDLAAYPGDS